jgi:hypothetical protein
MKDLLRFMRSRRSSQKATPSDPPAHLGVAGGPVGPGTLTSDEQARIEASPVSE